MNSKIIVMQQSLRFLFAFDCNLLYSGVDRIPSVPLPVCVSRLFVSSVCCLLPALVPTQSNNFWWHHRIIAVPSDRCKIKFWPCRHHFVLIRLVWVSSFRRPIVSCANHLIVRLLCTRTTRRLVFTSLIQLMLIMCFRQSDQQHSSSEKSQS